MGALTAFSRVTPPIWMHDQTILTRSFDPMYQHLMPAEICNWHATAYTLLDFLFGPVRYRIDIYIFVNNMTTRI